MNDEYKRLEELLELYKKRCKELEEKIETYKEENETYKKEIETFKEKQRSVSEKRRAAVMKRWHKSGSNTNTPSLTTNAPRRLKDVVDENVRELSDDPDKKALAFQTQLYQIDMERETNFTRPSEEDVYEQIYTYTMGASYIDARDEARQFMDYYDANGWMMGRTPMRDWRAAARNWVNMRTRNFGNNKQKQADYENDRAYIEAIRNIEKEAEYRRIHGEPKLYY